MVVVEVFRWSCGCSGDVMAGSCSCSGSGGGSASANAVASGRSSGSRSGSGSGCWEIHMRRTHSENGLLSKHLQNPYHHPRSAHELSQHRIASPSINPKHL